MPVRVMKPIKGQMAQTVLGRGQFPVTNPYFTGGPGEAQRRYRAQKRGPTILEDLLPGGRRESVPEEPETGQRHLFDPESVPMAEAHTQTPEQFAKDPRTWWHGRMSAEKSRLTPGGSPMEGFHAGTRGAAEQRLKHVTGRRTARPGTAGHLFPLRITGPVGLPEQMMGDVGSHRRLGRVPMEPWRAMAYPEPPIKGGGYLYENIVEAPGSISVGVPRRKGFLSTYGESVKGAEEEGKQVHPLISWAARQRPEHIGEEYPRMRRWNPEGHRYAQEHMTIPHENVYGPEPSGMSGGDVERRSYQTEGGEMQRVWRRRESGPGTALLGKQWERQ